MEKIYLMLKPSEALVARCASRIYSAFIVSGRVDEGQEREWMERAVRDAIEIARIADESIISDDEMS